MNFDKEYKSGEKKKFFGWGGGGKGGGSVVEKGAGSERKVGISYI